MQVLKFGGSSLADAKNMLKAADIIAKNEELHMQSVQLVIRFFQILVPVADGLERRVIAAQVEVVAPEGLVIERADYLKALFAGDYQRGIAARVAHVFAPIEVPVKRLRAAHKGKVKIHIRINEHPLFLRLCGRRAGSRAAHSK